MIYENNLASLKQTHPTIYTQLTKHQEQQAGEISQHPNNSNCNNMRYYHANNQNLLAYDHDPQLIANKQISTIPPDSDGLLLIAGLGLGYLALCALKQRKDLLQIVLIEPNLDMFLAALKSTDMRDFFSNQKISLFIGELDNVNFTATCSAVATTRDIHIIDHKPSFSWQPAQYQNALDSAFSILNNLQISGSTSIQKAEFFFKNRFATLKTLHHTLPADNLHGIFRNKPAILVAAGPSLSNELPLLKEIYKKCILICVDTVLPTLIANDIMPDFVTSADYSLLNFEKVAPFAGRNMPFSLFALPKTNPLIIKRLMPRRTFIGFNRDAGQNWIIDLLKIKRPLPTVTSVAQLSLGLAILTEANPIIMIGQDLSYTDSSSYHVAGTLIHEGLAATQSSEEDRQVEPGVNGTTVKTDRAFMEMNFHIEEITKNNPQRFINSTSKGLKISGTEEIPLQTVMQTMLPEEFSVDEILRATVDRQPHYQAQKVIYKGHAIIKEISQVRRQLKIFIEKTRSVSKAAVKLAIKKPMPRHEQDLPPSLSKELQKIQSMNDTINSYRLTWDMLAEKTFSLQSEIDIRQKINQGVRQREGYLPWLREEMKRFRFAQEGRLKAVFDLREEVNKLLTHLEQEQNYAKTTDKKEQLNDLLKIYIQSEDYALADKLMQEWQEDSDTPQQTRLKQIYQGAIHAALFPENINQYWHSIVKDASPDEVQTIKKLAIKNANTWLESYRQYSSNMPLTNKCLHRLSNLLHFTGNELIAEIIKLWDKSRDKVICLLDEQNMKKAGRILQQWQVLEKWLPEDYSQTKDKLTLHQTAPLPNKATNDQANIHQADSLALLARNFLENGQFDQGLAALEQAVQLAPNKATMWEELGDVLIEQKDIPGAIMAYEKCLRALPKRTITYAKLLEARQQSDAHSATGTDQ